MADFTTINQEIDNNIKQNGVNAITGQKLNTVLKDMMSAVNTEKQDTISDLEDIRDGAAAGATAFQKPSDGIPATDMDADVQVALDNAENAVLYEEQSTKTDQQRNTALANVSNQTADSITGKMGYKVLDPTKTFASQVTAENTIYEIRDVFDINGGSVTIPTGCTLKFNGGKLFNGSIVFNNTTLEKEDSDIIFSDVTSFSGSIFGYFTPENASYGISGDCFSALLTFLKLGQNLLKVKTLTLANDTDFHDVWLDAERIELNGHTLKLGGSTNIVKDGNLTPTKSQNQSILVIGTNGIVNNGRVIVGSCYGYELHIGLLVGTKLEFILDSNNEGFAYSSFYLNTVTNIELSAASGVTGTWINSNRFVLNRCISFIVKSSLTYFSNNVIDMGCFEGAFNIRLEIGNNNYFKYIRGESVSQGRGQIYFGENTSTNTLDVIFYPYTQIYDYGRGNIINETDWNNFRLLDKANLSLQDVKKNLQSRIMGMTLSQDETYLVPSSTPDIIGTETAFARYYQSCFIPYKQRMVIIAILDVVAKNEPGLAFAYELYDENFSPVSVKDSNGNAKSLAMITTTQEAYNNHKAGTYFLPFTQQANYRPGGTHTVNNDYTVFMFDDRPVFSAIASGAEGLEESLAAVKYITISVIGSAYYYSFNSQLLSVGVSLYEPNFKRREFETDIQS